MNKIALIIQREYLSRVKNKSFLVVTFLVPLLLIGVYALIIVLTKNSFESSGATVHVVDQSGVFEGKLPSNDRITYIMTEGQMAEERSRFAEMDQSKHYLLIIPETLGDRFSVELLSSESPGLIVQSQISDDLENTLREHRLEISGIDAETLQSIDPKISVNAKEITADGEKDSSTAASMIIAMSLSVLIYITLFIYGSQVMRGIIEAV